jgi:hypothetical protein
MRPEIFTWALSVASPTRVAEPVSALTAQWPAAIAAEPDAGSPDAPRATTTIVWIPHVGGRNTTWVAYAAFCRMCGTVSTSKRRPPAPGSPS